MQQVQVRVPFAQRGTALLSLAGVMQGNAFQCNVAQPQPRESMRSTALPQEGAYFFLSPRLAQLHQISKYKWCNFINASLAVRISSTFVNIGLHFL